ncbi:hypothetical protein [Kamptonema formosum]|uniref:hypothetical protein n=1 Tax=Kamptonema formosum TaxID=331992 RepID=UPI0003486A4E|nr:hypothetical protein [Oscillatoria sp. PCC 10802]
MQSQNSPAAAKSRNGLILAALAGIGVATLALPQASFAQACSDGQTLQGCPSPNERDSFSGLDNGQLNMYDIIHRAQMGTITNINEFTAEQRQNLNSAADDFRAQQLQRMQQAQQQAAPVEPAAAPAPAPQN